MGRPALWVPMVCEQCAVTIQAKPHDVRHGRRYCSNRCRHGAQRGRPQPWHRGNRFAWRGDRASRNTNHWRARQVKPHGPCERCDGPGEVVHHKDENPRNNALENLERLCRPCHARHHLAEKELKARVK